eukprot:355705-Ditylum_brightwellii.AAC.1
MPSSEEEAFLKKSTTTLFIDEVSEFMMIGSWGAAAFVQVKNSDSFADVRSWIIQYLDEDTQFCGCFKGGGG